MMSEVRNEHNHELCNECVAEVVSTISDEPYAIQWAEYWCARHLCAEEIIDGFYMGIWSMLRISFEKSFRKLTDLEWEMYKKLHMEGKSDLEIAKVINLQYSEVSTNSDQNMTLNSTTKPKLAKNLEPPNQQDSSPSP